MHLMASVTDGMVSRDTDLASSTNYKQKGRFKRFVRFLRNMDLRRTPSSPSTAQVSRMQSCLILRNISDLMNMAKQLSLPYSQELLNPPSLMWQRLPERTSGGIQHRMPTIKVSVQLPQSYVDKKTDTQTPDIVLVSL